MKGRKEGGKKKEGERKEGRKVEGEKKVKGRITTRKERLSVTSSTYMEGRKEGL